MKAISKRRVIRENHTQQMNVICRVLSKSCGAGKSTFAVMQRALDAFYAEDDEVPENQMLAAYRVFRAAMLNGGKS
jgi:hypothetical protein